ncbi:MAG: N-acetyltransferase family protein [Cyclobacteriaceae bacterium]
MNSKITVSIRRASLDDLQEVTELFRDTILHIGKSEYSEKQINAWAERYTLTNRWQDRIRHQYFLIAEFEDEIVGFGSITSDAHIDTLYVHKDYQQEGIGSTLLQAMIDHARELGHGDVYADVALTGRSFFKKQGFRMLKPVQQVLEGVVFVNFIMTKKI